MPRTRVAFPLSPTSGHRRTLAAALASLGLLALAGCSPASPAATAPSTTATPEEQEHGFVEGAEELSEAQTSIASIGADGSVHVLNVLTGESIPLDTVAAPDWATSDGRFVFSGASDGSASTQIVDTGVWTVPHGDHVHYYRATPGMAGELAQAGPAHVASTEDTVTLSYETSGTTIVLDRHALGQGETRELSRIESEAHAAAAAPVGNAVVASSVDASSAAPILSPYALDGQVLGDGVECPGLSDVQQTSLGATFACTDGLVFAVAADSAAPEAAPELTKVPYPEGAAAAAATLDNRPNRPTVAGPAGDSGIWLASSRTREISFIETDAPILVAVAVADDDNRIVALDDQGTLLVIDGETGAVTGTQAGLVGTPESAASIHLSVDTSRAYLSSTASTALHEIDYKDGARVARTLELPSAPAFAFETGN